MRTYGRIYSPDGSYVWQEVDTDDNGFDDDVWITTLIQVLKLNLGESPFYAQYGIPAQQTVVTQVFPDYYAAMTQQQFAPYFASLIISKIDARDDLGVPYPAYSVNIVKNTGAVVSATVPV